MSRRTRRALRTQPPPTHPPIAQFRNNIISLPEALRGSFVGELFFGTEYEEGQQQLGIPPTFEHTGPSAGVAALQEATPDPQNIPRFATDGSQANILQQVRHALPSVEAGLSCYRSFFSLSPGYRPFPAHRHCGPTLGHHVRPRHDIPPVRGPIGHGVSSS